MMSTEEELNEAYAVVNKDSITVPQILVSPAVITMTNSQLILFKAQEYAKDIIEKAIEINTGFTSLDIHGYDVGVLLDSTESQIIFQAKEVVQDIIETALEINSALGSVEAEKVLEIANAEGLFETISHDGVESLQVQALEKARELVHNAVTRAVEIINIQTASCCEHSRGRGTGLKSIESQMTMFKAQEIVNRVIRQAMGMNIGNFRSEILPEPTKQNAKVAALL